MNARSLAVIILSLCVTVPAMAADFATGSFKLYGEPHHQVNNFCDHGTKLTLDKAAVNGNVAFLENFLHGACEIFVPANPRMYKITSVKDDGCGSTIYKGSYQGNRGTFEVEIVDNRGRLCENVIPALIVVTEKGPNGEATMYSLDR
jgi:hypothetical protein